MAGEPRSRLAIFVQFRTREKPTSCEGCIEQRRAMPFTQDEPVAIWPLGPCRINSQCPPIKTRNNIGHGKTTAEMRSLGFVNHADGVRTQLLCYFLKLVRFSAHSFPCTSPQSCECLLRS